VTTLMASRTSASLVCGRVHSNRLDAAEDRRGDARMKIELIADGKRSSEVQLVTAMLN
jgi:hypothetical protein